jgi:hypothetical protein
MKTVHATLVLAAMSLLASCSAGDITSLPNIQPGAEPPIRTDALSYELQAWGRNGVATEIPIRFHNVTRRDLYIVNCHGMLAPVLQKRVDGEWQSFWAPVLPMCLSSPIRIRPGHVLERVVAVYGALPPSNIAPEFAGADVEGTYRMVLTSVVLNYDAYRQDFGDPVPLEYRVSNEFELRR